ncbi:MAG: hypothetical protein LC121_24485 [Anaerolineae bacterium]|nr:hypothetical protein [Anaerolineae bacterium]
MTGPLVSSALTPASHRFNWPGHEGARRGSTYNEAVGSREGIQPAYTDPYGAPVIEQ